jgi:NAD-dependent SIR2 family protein deacetylase
MAVNYSRLPPLEAAAEVLSQAEALLVCAGAGMGVDAGLPDFTSPGGFWNAYPAARKLGLSFAALANPEWFEKDSRLAWGFYGHRYQLYRDTAQHEGHAILARWARRMEHGAFVFTSNVDGFFRKSGFEGENIVECHGSLMMLQCVKPCCAASWPMPAGTIIEVDPETLRATGELPRCISCGGLARPNVLMFNDATWMDGRSIAQNIRFRLWLRSLARGKLAVVELGAGTTIPTVRDTAEEVSRAAGVPLIRINPVNNKGPRDCIRIAEGAREALRQIDARLAGIGKAAGG